jgi:hypothetical protein
VTAGVVRTFTPDVDRLHLAASRSRSRSRSQNFFREAASTAPNTRCAASAAARLRVEHCDRDSVRIEPKAMWADLTTAHVLRGVERVAVVADAWWIDRVADGAATMTDVEARGFDTTRRDDAVAWLRS